ncbi:hypothetical protein [Marinoscillum sp.]|uniref:hypothetical protein n=1 Tax=Marinoscillum sp. TaxID=2024838 RepID=UPI003BABFAF2
MRYLGGLIVFIAFGCGNSAEHVLNKHYQSLGDISEVTNIVAKADCTGPDGTYQTITKSSTQDDYLLFLQKYDYKPNPFYALIKTKEKGYGLDSSLTAQGPLSNAVIAVLKAHEFHEMMMQPDQRYFGLKQLEDTSFFDQRCHQLIGSDHLGLPVRLFFDKKTNLMAGIAQANPYKKGEIICVHFEDWQYSNEFPIFNRVNIWQGKKDHYVLDYKKIVFNHPEFEKLQIEEK